jgi:O-antigen ligase
LERFSSVQLAEGYEGRARIAASAFQAGLQFLPFGSGLGTFGDMFRRYQADSPSVYFDHAHNDYVELFVELGVAGVVAAALALAAYARRWGQLLRQGGERGLERIQLAAGLGMLAMLAHGFSDFNFHIPANAIYFSFLAGVFFLTPASDRA